MNSSPISILAIQQCVAEFYGISLQDMVGSGRARKKSRPRMMAMYLARRLTPQSFPAVGRAFNKDHTTVLHAVRCIDAALAQYPELEAEKAELIKRIGLQEVPPGSTGALFLPVTIPKDEGAHGN